MNQHPAQSDEKLKSILIQAFQDQMRKRGILPKDPWKAKDVVAWLETIGGRMTPCRNQSYSESVLKITLEAGNPANENFVYFHVPCIPIARGKIQAVMLIEIPCEVADKVLVLNYFPD